MREKTGMFIKNTWMIQESGPNPRTLRFCLPFRRERGDLESHQCSITRIYSLSGSRKDPESPERTLCVSNVINDS